jgi:hypothetical protein
MPEKIGFAASPLARLETGRKQRVGLKSLMT